MVKAAFYAWISDGHFKEGTPENIIASWDKASEQLLRRKLSSVPLWEITNFYFFKSIYKKVMNDKLFRVTDRETHSDFAQIGQLYLKFLKSKQILNRAPQPMIVAETEPTKPETAINEPTITQPLIVNFNRPDLCAKTHPVNCAMNGQVVIPDKYNWPRLLVAITERFIAEKNPNLDVLDRMPLFGGKVLFWPQKPEFGHGAQLSNGKWIYIKYDSQSIVTIIGRLCCHCGVDLDDVVISYLPKNEYISRDERYTCSSAELETMVDDNVKSAVVSILEERFPNGIRPNSAIDINKLKNYYCEIMGEGIPTDINIPSLLDLIGIRHGEKVFVISSAGRKSLAELLDRLISEDNRLFYYDEFYDIHADLLLAMHIFSSELLKTVLYNILPSLRYSRSYFATEGKVTLESEMLRCYETAVCLSYEQFKANLSYVPLDKIKQILAQNSDFIWVHTGVYTHSSKVEIDWSEWHAVENKVMSEITEHGYTSLASFDVSASLELNPDLSETAVKNGLYQVCLADRYEKRGVIITLKGTALNSVDVFEDYCLTHDRLTLGELLKFEKEINGSVHSQSLFVAYDNMVRVDRNTFVCDDKINFDVEATDNALELFVNADVIPLRAVTSFTSFPYIDGYQWNLFLLESYCKRFSKQFKYQCLSVNSRNVGAVFRKSAGFADYAAVLATAMANTSTRH
jgi:hypothetical protein